MLTLKQTAARIIAGVDQTIAIKEHVDAWNRTHDAGLYADEPDLTGIPHLDAWLAGAAHYEANLIGREYPSWANDPLRFLSAPFFIGGEKMRLLALTETPEAFRMRNVFTGKTSITSPDFESSISNDDGKAALQHLAAGRAIYYSDSKHPKGLVKEHPDGRKQLVRIGENHEIIVLKEL
ncbi:MAG: hypothetical protein Q7K57_52365 [Burkholderiaceae bacterium]|nr:hypothetical protein [Burkholderiaceae bacterium]